MQIKDINWDVVISKSLGKTTTDHSDCITTSPQPDNQRNPYDDYLLEQKCLNSLPVVTPEEQVFYLGAPHFRAG